MANIASFDVQCCTVENTLALVVVGVFSAVEDHVNTVRVNIAVPRTIDANIISGTEKNASILLSSIDCTRPGILNVVIIAREAVRAVKQQKVAVGGLVQVGCLHDAVVAASLVVEYNLWAIQKRQSVSSHSLDLDWDRDVVARRPAGLTGGRSTSAVAVDLPEDPSILSVIVAGRVNNTAILIIADQRVGLRLVTADDGPGSSRADAVVSTILAGSIIHDICSVILK